MFTLNYNPALIPCIRDANILAQDPLVLIDVGCSGGIDDVWRSWEPNLVAHGFDPQQGEVARLNQLETNHAVRYWSYFVGLDDSHPFHIKKKQADPVCDQYHSFPWSRTSAGYASEMQTKAAPLQSNPIFENETTAKIGVAEFVGEQNLANVDFIKIDTDGGDLEVLWSCEDMLRSCNVLGLMIEAPFTGGHTEADNSFHNIDRLMRKHGYRLYGLVVNSYSRRDLPLPFMHDILAQTKGGQTMWGDAVYFQDAASPVHRNVWGAGLTISKLIKLAGLYESFGYSDCAAEMLIHYRQTLQSHFDVDSLLDRLVPQFQGKQYSYKEYCQLFETQTEAFFPKCYNKPPKSETQVEVQAAPAPAPKRPLWRRAAGKVWRTLRRAG